MPKPDFFNNPSNFQFRVTFDKNFVHFRVGHHVGFDKPIYADLNLLGIFLIELLRCPVTHEIIGKYAQESEYFQFKFSWFVFDTERNFFTALQDFECLTKDNDDRYYAKLIWPKSAYDTPRQLIEKKQKLLLEMADNIEKLFLKVYEQNIENNLSEVEALVKYSENLLRK